MAKYWNWLQQADVTVLHTNAWFTFSSRYSSILLARCERDEVCTNVNIHILVWESSIMRKDIRDILVFFDSWLIYRYVSESFETRREQVASMENETNVPFTLSFSSCLVLSRWECKQSIMLYWYSLPVHTCLWRRYITVLRYMSVPIFLYFVVLQLGPWAVPHRLVWGRWSLEKLNNISEEILQKKIENKNKILRYLLKKILEMFWRISEKIVQIL